MKTMIQVVDYSNGEDLCWIAVDSIQKVEEPYRHHCLITTANGKYSVAESIDELAERAEMKLKRL